MAYVFTVRVHQTKKDAHKSIVVEETVWHHGNGGTWHQADGAHVLTMGETGTSGALRFQRANGAGEGDLYFFVMGVDAHKPWVDCLVDLKHNETCCALHPTYYEAKHRCPVREKHEKEVCKKDCKGREYKICCHPQNEKHCIVEIHHE